MFERGDSARGRRGDRHSELGSPMWTNYVDVREGDMERRRHGDPSAGRLACFGVLGGSDVPVQTYGLGGAAAGLAAAGGGVAGLLDVLADGAFLSYSAMMSCVMSMLLAA
jgi:hypothetical protein